MRCHLSRLILHQYETSPFSEKIRRILAWKQLDWVAVRAPAIMPKPDLIALTGGYRKIPVLQVGNHVYCDSARIADYLEDLQPRPTLYPTPLARSVADWADGALFESTVPMIMRPTRFDDLVRWMTPAEQQGLLQDRKNMSQGAARTAPGAKSLLTYFGVYVGRLEAALAAQEYLLGGEPCIADFSAYHSLWIVASVSPERLAGRSNLHAWMQRIAALPAPRITSMTGAEATEVARASDPIWIPSEAFQDPMRLAPDTAVSVRANDYGRDAVSGVLVSSTANEVVLRRDDAHAGRVYVHFPRLGFEVTPA
jgi:glutathione S-transferase